MKLLKAAGSLEDSRPALGSDCAGLLMEVVPQVMRAMRSEVRRHREDLSMPQFRALWFLSRRDGSSLSDVAERVGMPLPTMSKLVDVLVDRRLVTRDASAVDRRRVVLAL